jgi:hypothetical protein
MHAIMTLLHLEMRIAVVCEHLFVILKQSVVQAVNSIHLFGAVHMDTVSD